MIISHNRPKYFGSCFYGLTVYHISPFLSILLRGFFPIFSFFLNIYSIIILIYTRYNFSLYHTARNWFFNVCHRPFTSFPSSVAFPLRKKDSFSTIKTALRNFPQDGFTIRVSSPEDDEIIVYLSATFAKDPFFTPERNCIPPSRLRSIRDPTSPQPGCSLPGYGSSERQSSRGRYRHRR